MKLTARVIANFWPRVEKRDVGCWEWRGKRDVNGYGRLGCKLAHRISYLLAHGTLPPRGYDLDHLCRNPGCVRADHLEAVTHAENCRRGIAGPVNSARLRARTHCKRGHAFTAENTGHDHRGDRYCRECTRQLHRGYYYADVQRSRAAGRKKARARRQQREEAA